MQLLAVVIVTEMVAVVMVTGDGGLSGVGCVGGGAVVLCCWCGFGGGAVVSCC